MSQPWSKPLDVERLAEAEADIDFAVPLAELPRLRSQLASVEGEVRGRVHFGKETRVPFAQIEMSGTARLVCQRCLEPMEVPIESTTRVGLIDTESELGRVPADLEPMLAPGGRTSVGDLIEEELLLALPIVPLHESAEDCVVAPDAPLVAEADDVELETQKPFERLGELLKRKP